MVQIVLYMCEGKVLMDMLFSFKNKYHYTYPNTYMFPALLPHYICVLSGMTSLGVRRHASQWKGESKGVVVKLTRERASEGWKQFLVSLCVCYR